MVYPQCVEVLLYMPQPFPEPFEDAVVRRGVVVPLFISPSVRWESPVLTIEVLVVGRCSCLCVEEEEVRVLPCLHAIPVNPDG